MTTAPNSVTMAYDPLTRLYQLADGSSTTRFAYDGVNMIAEYDGSNTLTRRYVFGPGGPIVWYQIGDGTPRRFLHADQQGSIIAVTNDSGTMIGGGNYDEYGNPQSGAISGRFGYTGQAWLAELGIWYYRARVYNPALGRFMQTDPVGYAGGMNLYAYVGGDPVNRSDPSGLYYDPPPCTTQPQTCTPDIPPGDQPAPITDDTIVVTGENIRPIDFSACNACFPDADLGMFDFQPSTGTGFMAGDRGGGGSGQASPHPSSLPQTRRPSPREDRPLINSEACRMAVDAALGYFGILWGALEGMEAAEAIGLGARLGAFGGRIGAAIGAITVGGLYFALKAERERLAQLLCR